MHHRTSDNATICKLVEVLEAAGDKGKTSWTLSSIMKSVCVGTIVSEARRCGLTSDANMRAGQSQDGRYTDTEWRDEMNIKEFCKAHSACTEGREWALANCKTMQDVWDTAHPDWVVWIATQKGVLTDKELRLFACWCVRQVWDLLTDERSRTAVEVAERFANGEATAEELSAAETAAWYAAWYVEEGAKWSKWAAWAAWHAAYDARAAFATSFARDAAYDARAAFATSSAGDAARSTSAARDAANAAANASARDAAGDAANAAQAEYLRSNCKPCFSEVKP